MKNTKKAFTLVELIVVITILAILGTIAFISLQGYSADARNTKRASDLNQLSSAIKTSTAREASMLAFVDSQTGSELSTGSIAGISLSSAASYSAGIPNYIAIDVKPSDFKDPNDIDYKIGVTTKIGGKYELAASMEWADWKVAKIEGTYVARKDDLSIAVNIAWTNRAELNSVSDINKLKKWDFVNWVTIISISGDGKNLVFNWDPGSSPLTLTGEVVGLIRSKTQTGVSVTDRGSNLPY